MRQQRGLDRERPDGHRIARLEQFELIRITEHRRPIESEHGIQSAGQGVDRQRRGWSVHERPGAKERVEIGAVIGVTVADQDRVDLVGGNRAQQLRQDGVAGIDQQPEAVVFEEIAAARLAGCRPAATAADDG